MQDVYHMGVQNRKGRLGLYLASSRSASLQEKQQRLVRGGSLTVHTGADTELSPRGWQRLAGLSHLLGGAPGTALGPGWCLPVPCGTSNGM